MHGNDHAFSSMLYSTCCKVCVTLNLTATMHMCTCTHAHVQELLTTIAHTQQYVYGPENETGS